MAFVSLPVKYHKSIVLSNWSLLVVTRFEGITELGRSACFDSFCRFVLKRLEYESSVFVARHVAHRGCGPK
jgi:hypothetical protein